MARRKNTKRIDPRYFLNETADRGLDEDNNCKEQAVGVIQDQRDLDDQVRQAEQHGGEWGPGPEDFKKLKLRAEKIMQQCPDVLKSGPGGWWVLASGEQAPYLEEAEEE